MCCFKYILLSYYDLVSWNYFFRFLKQKCIVSAIVWFVGIFFFQIKSKFVRSNFHTILIFYNMCLVWNLEMSTSKKIKEKVPCSFHIILVFYSFMTSKRQKKIINSRIYVFSPLLFIFCIFLFSCILQIRYPHTHTLTR